MKKTLLNNLKLIAFGMVFAISLSYVHATYWAGSGNTYSDPTTPASGCTSTTGTATPPQCNTPALPLNVSTLDQIKPKGGCAVSNCGGLSLLKTFWVELGAEFDGTTFLNGTVGAGTGSMAANSTVRFGGIDPTNHPQPVSIAMSGGLSANTLLQSGVLVNSGSNLPICSDQNGYVTLCDVTYVCSNLSGGPYTTVPPNYTQNPDGTCSLRTKRFLAKYYEYDYTSPGGLVGNVPGGNYQYYVTPSPNTYQAIQYVDQIGFYNGDINSGNWIYNEIPGVQSVTSNSSRLLDVGERGSYDIKISSNISYGIKGQFGSDTNFIGGNIYLKVNSTWYQMDSNVTNVLSEEYPVPGKNRLDFDQYFPSGANSFGSGGSGDTYKYTGQNVINFEKTLALNPQDTVDVYIFLYGYSSRGSFFDGGGIFSGGPFTNGDYNRFFDGIKINDTVFDITETPSQ